MTDHRNRALNPEPRVIRQFTALYLVTPEADVWRVFDCAANGGERGVPTVTRQASHRLFVSNASGAARIHAFPDIAPREIDAVSLHTQLLDSQPIEIGPVF